MHRRGITQRPGLYFLGLPWLHKWKSATLLGAAEDAEHVVADIAAQLGAGDQSAVPNR
jgi:putative flavoprotein involved in K+ transport